MVTFLPVKVQLCIVHGHTQRKEESSMKQYELAIIIHPDLDDEAIEQALDRIRGWITESGGSIDKTDNWGKRRMSYEIQKQNEGIYYLIDITHPPNAIADLEKNITILESVMRHMIVVK
jgi:small subunit ribosomal protein S6